MRRLFNLLFLLIVVGFFAYSKLGKNSWNKLNSLLDSSPATSTISGWREVGEGVERLEYQFASSTGARHIVYRIPSSGFRWRFELATSSKRLLDWVEVLPQANILINGVYFHDDQLPSGWLVTRGERMGTRVFDREKSAVVTLQPRLDIQPTPSALESRRGYVEAAQSFPLLIWQGRVAVESDSGRFARRSWLGLDEQGRAYLGVVPDLPVTLYELANMIQDLPVSWRAVLNLDGGLSTGLVHRSEKQKELIDSFVGVPNVIVVERENN